MRKTTQKLQKNIYPSRGQQSLLLYRKKLSSRKEDKIRQLTELKNVKIHVSSEKSIFFFEVQNELLYQKTTGKPIKWIICFSAVLSKVFFYKRALLL